MLRVLNDDTIAPGTGFGMHPHNNMEIITIPWQGTLEHKDSMGNAGRIQHGEVQAMSAGTGIFHSEYNPGTEETKLFQIWIFPKTKNIQPRYEQRKFNVNERRNKFQVIVSPEKNNETIWINQDGYLSLGNFEKGKTAHYNIFRSGNGAYVMLVEGEIEVEGIRLAKRDAIGIYDTDKITIKANSDSEIMIIDVPMNYNNQVLD